MYCSLPGYFKPGTSHSDWAQHWLRAYHLASHRHTHTISYRVNKLVVAPSQEPSMLALAPPLHSPLLLDPHLSEEFSDYSFSNSVLRDLAHLEGKDLGEQSSEEVLYSSYWRLKPGSLGETELIRRHEARQVNRNVRRAKLAHSPHLPVTILHPDTQSVVTSSERHALRSQPFHDAPTTSSSRNSYFASGNVSL